jgi:hypothetical protein
MQHWEILIIPLIAVGVWILGSIFKGVEEERQKDRLRRPGGDGGMGPRPRRPVTDLDRFLEEARRRRQAAGERRPEPTPEVRERAPESPRPTVLPARPVPTRTERPRPAAPVKQTPAPRRVDDAPLPASPRRQTPPSPIPEVRPVPVTVVVPVETRAEAEAKALTALPAVKVTPAAPTPATPVMASEKRRREVTPVMAQVVQLLRNPRNVATAFVLREIFDEPMCKRKR